MINIKVKTVLLGNSKVGKTSLVRRFIENKFIDSDVSTIGGAFVSKEVFSSSYGEVSLCIWDTAGEEKYESVTRAFYRNANAAIVCYDVTCAKSWSRAKGWVSKLRQFEEKCVIYLCATKLDLIKEMSASKAVSEDVLSAYISSVNIKQHFETSSKSGENVDIMFKTIANDYIQLNKENFAEYENLCLTSNDSEKTCCFKFF